MHVTIEGSFVYQHEQAYFLKIKVKEKAPYLSPDQTQGVARRTTLPFLVEVYSKKTKSSLLRLLV